MISNALARTDAKETLDKLDKDEKCKAKDFSRPARRCRRLKRRKFSNEKNGRSVTFGVDQLRDAVALLSELKGAAKIGAIRRTRNLVEVDRLGTEEKEKSRSVETKFTRDELVPMKDGEKGATIAPGVSEIVKRNARIALALFSGPIEQHLSVVRRDLIEICSFVVDRGKLQKRREKKTVFLRFSANEFDRLESEE